MVLFGLVGVRRLVRPPAVVVGLHPVVVVAGVVLSYDEFALDANLSWAGQPMFLDELTVYVVMRVPVAVVVGVSHLYFSKHGCLLNAP